MTFARNGGVPPPVRHAVGCRYSVRGTDTLTDSQGNPPMTGDITPRILLVEDDAMFRETVRDTLRGAGYQVDEAGDGQQALEKVTAFRPDLVLLDFDLPRLMGDEALEGMLDLRPGLVCYVLSGKDDLHQALWMGRHGAYGWIDKYVGTDRLLTTVAEGLRLRPRGYDLRRLITNYYPQPIALQYVRLMRLGPAASAAERLARARFIRSNRAVRRRCRSGSVS